MAESLKRILKNIIPVRLWDLSHALFSISGALYYGFPSHKLIVVGVTGTNGKSTVVELLHQIFSDFGFNVASFSSVREKIKNKQEPNRIKMTTPGRWFLQKFLDKAKNEGCQIAILEITSEGIKQYRHIGINFDAALITNLQPEHIESHGSFEAYREAKGKLFRRLARKKPGIKKISVINLDDPSAFFYTRFKADKKYGFGLLKENARNQRYSVIPDAVSFSADGVSFKLSGLEWSSSLPGDFNLYNVLAAISMGLAFELPAEKIRDSVKRVSGVPGRMEVVQEKPFRVIVDFAHTPDALEAVMRTARSFWAGSEGKLISVLGSTGGGRDRWKRPELGRVAERFCDKVILTNEDPYQEDPKFIIESIAKGMSLESYEIIIDRRQAISRALSLAQEGDVVLITGKGSEQIMMIADGAVPWDDREVVREEIKKLF